MPRRATSTKRTSDGGGAGPSARLSPVVEDGNEIAVELSPEPAERPVMRAPPPPDKGRSPPWYKRRPAFLRLMEESLSA